MLIMNLRGQVFLALLLPMVLALVAAGAIVGVYLSVYYGDSIQTTSDDMKDQQASVLAQVSSLISLLGRSALQGKINPMLLSSQLIRLQTAADLKSQWNESHNSINALEFSRWTHGEVTEIPDIPGLNTSTNRSYYYAMYIASHSSSISDLNVTTRANMREAASFDYLSQSMLRLGTSNQVYFAFESDGFFYFLPVMFKKYVYNPVESGYVAWKCARTMGEDKYDPRCRPFYIETVENGETERLTLATPYLMAEKNTIGQTVCAPVWSGGTLLHMHCLDFDLLELRDWMQTVKIGSAGYSYLVTEKGRPYIHPKLNESWSGTPPSRRIGVLERHSLPRCDFTEG